MTGLVLRLGDRLRVLVANLGAELQHVSIEGASEGEYQCTRLDESNAVMAMEQPEAFRKTGEPVS